MKNYLIVENVIAAQTPSVEKPFLNILHQFDQIIEIGFHRGGFSLWLYTNKKPQTELFCYDNDFSFKQVNNENINFLLGDCFEEKVKREIKNIIRRDGKSLVLCDGGHKNREFNTYCEFLKSGDVIMCHDYSEHLDEYRDLRNELNWPHEPESSYEEIQDSVKLFKLEPFFYNEFKRVLWGSFIKT